MKASQWALLGVNVAIATASLVRAWGFYEVILIYWLEALVVGAFTVARMIVVAAAGKPLGDWIDASEPLTRIFLLFVGVGVFVMKFGGFLLGMGLLVVMVPAFLNEGRGADVWSGLLAVGGGAAWAAVGLALSHGASFVVNFIGRREYERTNLVLLLFQPYLRLWLVVVALAAGLVVAALLPAFAATGVFGAVVVLVKTAADLVMHRLEHADLSATAGGSPSRPGGW